MLNVRLSWMSKVFASIYLRVRYIVLVVVLITIFKLCWYEELFDKAGGISHLRSTGKANYLESSPAVPLNKAMSFQIDPRIPTIQINYSKVSPISSNKSSPFSLPEIRHVAFLKVYKAGSTTVQNILYRFGYKRRLTFVLHRKSHILSVRPGDITPFIIPPAANKTFDILANHVVFNKAMFERYMPKDTKYIAIIREPYERFRSAYYYYRTVYHVSHLLPGYKGQDHFQRFIENQSQYEPVDPYRSKTNNRMALDFGYPSRHFKNITRFKKYLQEVGSIFHLVMISERFDESMILMKRLLRWSFEDILYVKLNSLPKPVDKSTIAQKIKCMKFQELDYILYDFFWKKFDRLVRRESPDFNDEVLAFKSARSSVNKFCSHSSEHQTPLIVPSTTWNVSFNVTRQDCMLMGRKEIPFCRILQVRQTKWLSEYGANKEFNNSILRHHH